MPESMVEATARRFYKILRPQPPFLAETEPDWEEWEDWEDWEKMGG